MNKAGDMDKTALKLAAELAEFDGVELASKIRSKDLSPREVVAASAAAIDVLDKELNFR